MAIGDYIIVGVFGAGFIVAGSLVMVAAKPPDEKSKPNTLLIVLGSLLLLAGVIVFAYLIRAYRKARAGGGGTVQNPLMGMNNVMGRLQARANARAAAAPAPAPDAPLPVANAVYINPNNTGGLSVRNNRAAPVVNVTVQPQR
jgi:flagellar basal body-associated protein FliL